MTARYLGEYWHLEHREMGRTLTGWAFRPTLLLSGEEVRPLGLDVPGKFGVGDFATSAVGSSSVPV